MNPVMQTTHGLNNGNCLSACLASIMEFDISEVPDFRGADWIVDMNLFLETFYLQAMFVSHENALPLIHKFTDEVFYIVTGQNKHCEEYDRHAVVYKDGEAVHDPSGGDTTFVDGTEFCIFFVSCKNG